MYRKSRDRTIPLLVNSFVQRHCQGCKLSLFFCFAIFSMFNWSLRPQGGWHSSRCWMQTAAQDVRTDIRVLRLLAKSGWRGEILHDITKKTSPYTSRRKWHFLLKITSNISWVRCQVWIEWGKVNTDTRHLGWERWAATSKQAAGAQLSMLEGSQTTVRLLLRANCESACNKDR